MQITRCSSNHGTSTQKHQECISPMFPSPTKPTWLPLGSDTCSLRRDMVLTRCGLLSVRFIELEVAPRKHVAITGRRQRIMLCRYTLATIFSTMWCKVENLRFLQRCVCRPTDRLDYTTICTERCWWCKDLSSLLCANFACIGISLAFSPETERWRPLCA